VRTNTQPALAHGAQQQQRCSCGVPHLPLCSRHEGISAQQLILAYSLSLNVLPLA
jgi:hypothetical protein